MPKVQSSSPSAEAQGRVPKAQSTRLSSQGSEPKAVPKAQSQRSTAQGSESKTECSRLRVQGRVPKVQNPRLCAQGSELKAECPRFKAQDRVPNAQSSRLHLLVCSAACSSVSSYLVPCCQPVWPSVCLPASLPATIRWIAQRGGSCVGDALSLDFGAQAHCCQLLHCIFAFLTQ